MTDQTKTVLIVGRSGGLGLGLAHEYHKRGWQVIGTVRSDHPEDRAPVVTWTTVNANISGTSLAERVSGKGSLSGHLPKCPAIQAETGKRRRWVSDGKADRPERNAVS
jgi:NAD(P)-dependent dehydrogenase (short-subunit alcohol dehydrogenase family)